MPTKNELTKIKKQVALIAKSKGTTVDEIIYDSLKTYVSENMDWVLENFAKMQDEKKQNSEPKKTTFPEKKEVSDDSSSQIY
jgi:hypothetical protein